MSEEKIKDVNKEAFKQAEKELLEQQVKKVKGFILETLQKMEAKKKEKEKVEEELRILKLDLEDLRNGRFEKIEERIEKSKVARGISVNPVLSQKLAYSLSQAGYGNVSTNLCNAVSQQWLNATSGTYDIQGKVYYL